MSGFDASDPAPRLVPDSALPPYSYVTGRFPHPTREPAGHSYGHVPLVPPSVTPERWGESRDYLWGCDLFNHGYYWEAHEAWEGLWHACGRSGPIAEFLQGLIKLAAAGVKAREGRPAGVERHAARAQELFCGVRTQAADNHFLGLELDRLIEIASELPAHVRTSEGSDAPVEVVFDFRLLPRG